PGVYYLRLTRDGWVFKERTAMSRNRDVTVFEKRISDLWMLRKFAHGATGPPKGKGCYYDEHELEHTRTGAKIDGQTWEWADLDRHRLVWAQDGKLYAGRLGTKGMGRVSELHDFNSMTFEP